MTASKRSCKTRARQRRLEQCASSLYTPAGVVSKIEATQAHLLSSGFRSRTIFQEADRMRALSRYAAAVALQRRSRGATSREPLELSSIQPPSPLIFLLSPTPALPLVARQLR